MKEVFAFMLPVLTLNTVNVWHWFVCAGLPMLLLTVALRRVRRQARGRVHVGPEVLTSGQQVVFDNGALVFELSPERSRSVLRKKNSLLEPVFELVIIEFQCVSWPPSPVTNFTCRCSNAVIHSGKIFIVRYSSGNSRKLWWHHVYKIDLCLRRWRIGWV